MNMIYSSTSYTFFFIISVQYAANNLRLYEPSNLSAGEDYWRIE